jgi:LysR family hydrogen peroxide-inducible transcriptional activator
MPDRALPEDRPMEIHEIRYFLATSETLNFTRAAEQCNVSQPALTRAIKSLEDKLGAGPLINRERGNTHLTELGRIMKPYFQQMLKQMEEARAKARAYVKLDGTSLAVGLMCTIGPLKLVDLFAGFNRRFHGIEIHLKDGPVSALEEALTKGEVDVAICCRPEELDDRFHVVPLFRERFVVAVAPHHPLARLEKISMRDLHNQRYLSRSNCEYYDYLRNIRERLGGIDIRCPYRSERDDWIQSMVLAGLGFTYIPEFAVTLPGLVVRPLVEPEVSRVVKLVTVRGRPHSPAVGAFVHEARCHKWDGGMRPATRPSLVA